MGRLTQGPTTDPPQQPMTTERPQPPEGHQRGEQCPSTYQRAEARTTTRGQTKTSEPTREPAEATAQTQARVRGLMRKPPEGQTKGHRGWRPSYRDDEGQHGTYGGKCQGTA